MDLIEKLNQLRLDDFDYISIKVFNKKGYWHKYLSGFYKQLKKKIRNSNSLVFKEMYIENGIYKIEVLDPLYE